MTTATVVLTMQDGLSEAEAAALVSGLAYKNTSQRPIDFQQIDRTVAITSITDSGLWSKHRNNTTSYITDQHHWPG
jgi:hypothetical protein